MKPKNYAWLVVLAVVAVAPLRLAAEANYASVVGMHPSARALARALDARLTVGQADDGSPVHVWHCRESAGGCRARIAALSRVITESSNRYNVDPFLTAAIAIRETGLNPMAIGPVGERGVIQLHPLYRGKHVRFVSDERHRKRCNRRPDACQGEVIDAGLKLLNWTKRKCGNTKEALGWYNSGHCQESIYTRGVLRERRRLLRLAKKLTPTKTAVFIN